MILDLYLGFIIIPNLTALENVEMALQILQESSGCENCLKKKSDSEQRMDNFPAQLGREQQKVSLPERCKESKAVVM